MADRVLQAAEQALAARTGRAETAAREQDRLPDPDSTKLRGRLAAIRALMRSWWQDVPRIIEHARQALGYLPKQDPWRGPAAIALGDAYEFQGDLTAAYRARREAVEACEAAGDMVFYMIAKLKVAITLRALGRLQQTMEICQQQLQLADDRGLSHTTMAGCFWAQWGEVLVELGDLDAALERAKKGVELTEGGDLALLGFSNLCLTKVLYSRGDLAGAEAIVKKLQDLARQHDLPPYISSPTAAWQATIWLTQGKLEAASQWARERALDVDKSPALVPQLEYVVLARILLAQGQLDKATGLLQRLLEVAKGGERISSVIEILSLHALASQAGGNTSRAMVMLERALTLAEPEGFVRIFVREGPPMAHLLYQAVTRGIAPDYARRLLAAFPVLEPDQTASLRKETPQSKLVEPLSEREREVLELISEGLTNPEIASRLYLSLNTVKVHTRNIYGKLNVHSRTQAVARSQALGLLPSS
jgi:LuxR family maltose regulon positive regulatory protein